MAQLNVKWTQSALEDLESARESVVSEFPQYLDQAIETISNSLDQLTKFPESGREGRVRGTRELVLSPSPFIIVYRIKNKSIEVLAFLHQSKKWL